MLELVTLRYVRVSHVTSPSLGAAVVFPAETAGVVEATRSRGTELACSLPRMQ